MNIPGFSFPKHDNCHETQSLVWYASMNKIPYRVFVRAEDAPIEWVAVGPCEWVQKILGWAPRPDYFPDFLRHLLWRNVWQTDKWPYGRRVFIKPADEHKRFMGFVTRGTWKGKKRGPYWCSDLVEFTSEWRYYVTNGEVVCSKWYCGVECPPPPFVQKFPDGWCGTVDLGRLADGHLALVEAHHPFSTGWYGKISEAEVYARWLWAGWNYLRLRQPMLGTLA